MKTYKDYNIIKCSDYNTMQMAKYDKRVEEWGEKMKFGGGTECFPQIAFYFFYSPTGIKRENGWVAVHKELDRSIWGESRPKLFKKLNTL